MHVIGYALAIIGAFTVAEMVFKLAGAIARCVSAGKYVDPSHDDRWAGGGW